MHVFELSLVVFSAHALLERLRRSSPLPGKWVLSHGSSSFMTATVSSNPVMAKLKRLKKSSDSCRKRLWTFRIIESDWSGGALHHPNVELEADTFTLMNMERSIGVHRLESFGPKVWLITRSPIYASSLTSTMRD